MNDYGKTALEIFGEYKVLETKYEILIRYIKRESEDGYINSKELLELISDLEGEKENE